MQGFDYQQALEGILEKDQRYQAGAYELVREALEYTLDGMEQDEVDTRGQHVTGQQLLLGVRDYALEQYGPMVLTVFEEWGLKRCEDIGEVVYNLIESKLFGKNEQDRREDFSAIYDFDKVFREPFLPLQKKLSDVLPVRKPRPAKRSSASEQEQR